MAPICARGRDEAQLRIHASNGPRNRVSSRTLERLGRAEPSLDPPQKACSGKNHRNRQVDRFTREGEAAWYGLVFPPLSGEGCALRIRLLKSVTWCTYQADVAQNALVCSGSLNVCKNSRLHQTCIMGWETETDRLRPVVM